MNIVEIRSHGAEHMQQATGDTRMRRDLWQLDSGATCHCTGNIRKFKVLDTSYRGTLGTAGEDTRIMGRGTAIITLRNGQYAELPDVLYVPGLRGNLLST